MKHKSRKIKFIFFMFLVPALASHTLFIIFPFLKSLYYSFTNFDGMSRQYKFVGIGNYIDLFHDSAMLASMSYTLFYTFSSIVLVTLFAIPLAIILDSGMKTRNLQRAVFFFPSVPSSLAIGYIWAYIFSPTDSGALNYLLHNLFGMERVPWLSDPLLARVSTVIVGVWASLGWHAVLYVANLQTIPHEYYEAAQIDGATWRQRLFHITIPMLSPAMTASLLILTTGGLKVFEIPFALTKGGPGFETHSISQVIILRGISEMFYGKASAMSIVLFLFIAIITIIQLKWTQGREARLR
ncbi:carbohydrate ABC transporter permease [Paenibacillus hodogayensis]|uniref:Carbohydrate ABC transporter permease n=1 Tax=Paenibacillus hodogayensis TaxID=279208 RepID=A0ABV5W7A2_9BACL